MIKELRRRAILDRVRVSQSNYALRFDGVDDYVEIPNSESYFSFIENTHIFTIKLRFKINDLSGRNLILATNLSSVYKGYAITFDTFQDRTSTIRLFLTNGIVGDFTSVSLFDNAINDNELHELEIKGKGLNDFEFILDGFVYENSDLIYQNTISQLPFPSNSDYNLDIGFFSPFNLFPLNGQIDYIKIWNQYKTDDSDVGIVANYQFNTGSGCQLLDSSGNNYHGDLMPDCPANSPEWIQL